MRLCSSRPVRFRKPDRSLSSPIATNGFALLLALVLLPLPAVAQTISTNLITGHAPDAATETLTGDPLYQNPAGADGTLGTVDDNFRLSDGSPALDAGDPAFAAPTTLLGIADEGPPDLGAFGHDPIPVELTSATARLDHTAAGDPYVQVRWTTAQEQNNALFRLLRGASSTPVLTVSGRGTTDQPQVYTARDTDLPATPATLHYRLVQVDTDGTATTVAQMSVRRTLPEAFATVAPNPVRGRWTLEMGLPGAQTATVEMVNLLGQRVARHRVPLQDGRGRLQQRLSVAPGTYWLRVSGAGTTLTRRVVVVR